MTRKVLTLALTLLITGFISSCAHKPSNPAVDPYENFNRAIFAFNQDIDHLVLRPIAKVYNRITPPPLQTGINNAFSNIGEITTLPNDLLQGKIKYVFLDFWRFFFNSTIGIGGLFDVASHIGLPKHRNSFGLTLAYWSGKNSKSPYLVLPFFGSSTFRSAFGLPVDFLTSPYPYIHPTTSYIAEGLMIVNMRSSFLPADKLLDDAFDPYIFARNAYLQRHNKVLNLIHLSKSVNIKRRQRN
jgi:phospholipid-binding lipoprotein MlaA